jgi:hypothetical protein
MKLKFFFIAILIVTLAVPSMDMQIFSIAFAQPSDKSFKGAEAPFIPPPESERIPKAPPSDGISINDIPPVGLGVTEEEEKDGGEEKDRDRLPPLTIREIKELPFDNITDSALIELKIISSNNSFTDPIKSIVEEIIKNDTLISDNNNINSFNSSKIKNKFDDTRLEQIFIAQDMSQDWETNIGTNETEMTSNTTEDQNVDDSILSTSELPTRDVLTFINNTKVDSNVTETAEEEQQPAITDELTTEGRNVTETAEEEQQPAITDELTTEGRNVTETGTQNNEDDLEDDGKTITIEEIPMQSEESQNEGATEGNVTIKGPLKVNNTSEDLELSTELPAELKQQKQTPSLTEAENDINKNESKMKITEVCNDEIDNDLDRIIDEEHECILKPSDIRPSNEQVGPRSATLDDEEKEKENNQQQNTKVEEENDKDQDELPEDPQLSKKSADEYNVIGEETLLEPEIRPDGVDIITSEEICNDEIDNDLDGIIDEEHECINK